MPNSAQGAVQLRMPATASYMLLARLEVGAIGGILDCSVDEIDDLRLAVEELCLWVMRQPRDRRGTLQVGLWWDDQTLEATCDLEPDDVAMTEPAEVDELTDGLSRQILAALVDEHGMMTDDGRIHGWLRKKRLET